MPLAGLTLMIAAELVGSSPVPSRPWTDEIVYGIIIEKFFDADPSNNVMKARFGKDRAKYEGGFWGGDLAGIRAKLDEVADLGVTAILIYPVMRNDENPVGKFLPTGYRPRDYESVDRNFGDVAAVRSVVDAAHDRGLKVILDMPITLPGFEHPFLGDPGRKSWFGPKSEYGVPRWKAENPEVADYLIGVCKRWKERSGCDGMRIDSAHLQPMSFWKRFVAELKAAPPRPDFVILPELTVDPRQIGGFIREAGFDGAYDFSALRCREVFGRGEDVAQLAFAGREAHQFYPDPRAMMAPIDNYEKAFVDFANGPKAARTKLALAYILTLDRVPLLYAGNELGIAFTEVGGAFPPGRRDSSFLRDVKALIALRRREPALIRGDYTELAARDGVFAYLRTAGEERILVVLNGSDRPRDYSRPIAGRPWKSLRLDDLQAGGLAKMAGDELPLRAEAFGARIVKVR
ncbi:Neopullulanase [Aquisphaera giovannonii]|uniref:Neopullulanase n=1 Tax=Aquisphaera giovannonii TaxID=406548 RepID=A0A5B9VX74_9BACT|nr:alpha-amylase family glycosyl hydrolase [Aquisphaera giovannonii]QEH32719.1 Neopullulanase [Aquisphaera giovannonii]